RSATGAWHATVRAAARPSAAWRAGKQRQWKTEGVWVAWRVLERSPCLSHLLDKLMKTRRWRDALLQQEDLNFLLTNRLPRMALTRFMGWFSKLSNPWVRDASIAVWRLFAELDLSD